MRPRGQNCNCKDREACNLDPHLTYGWLLFSLLVACIQIFSSTITTVDAQDEAVKSCQRDFIYGLLSSSLQIPIQRTTTLPRCNNKSIHFLEFLNPVSADKILSGQPETSAISCGTTKAVFRVGDPAAILIMPSTTPLQKGASRTH